MKTHHTSLPNTAYSTGCSGEGLLECSFELRNTLMYWQSNGYCFGFNGKERDNEGMGGGGSTYDYGFRIYNGQIGKFLSVDPLFKDFPWNSIYAFAENDVIRSIDLEGLEKHTLSDNNPIYGPYSLDYLNKYNSLLELTKDQYITALQSKNYAGAINVIRTNYQLYKLGKASYEISVDSYYDGLVVDLDKNNIEVNPSSFTPVLSNYHFNFSKVLPYSHEFIHLFQKNLNMYDKNEREFLAYEFMANPNNSFIKKKLPDWEIKFEELDIQDKSIFANQALNYYNSLDSEKREKYKES